MTAIKTILAGGVAFAALASAAPAAAQYPGYGYGYGSNGGLGAIIEAIIGGGRYGRYNQGYGQNDRYLVEQCARATEYRLQRNYGQAGYGYGNPYGQYGGPYGGYGNQYGSQARIISITNVQRRSGGGLKVYGTATSGRGGYGGYGGQYGGYGNYGGGYGYAQAGADLRFDCNVSYRGRVTDVDIKRNSYGYYGY